MEDHSPSMPSRTTSEFVLEPAETERLANLSGPFDGHLRMIELRLGVEIANRGNVFRVVGPQVAVGKAEKLLRDLWRDAAEETFDEPAIHLRLTEIDADDVASDGIEPQEVSDPRQARHHPRPRRQPGRSTCTPSPPTTSTSASVRPAPARRSSPSPARWKH